MKTDEHIIRYLRHRARRRKRDIRGLKLARMMGMTLPILKLKSLAGMPWGVTTMWWDGGMELAMRLTPVRYAKNVSFSADRPHFWRDHKGRGYAMKELRKGERRHHPKPGSAFEWRQLERNHNGGPIMLDKEIEQFHADLLESVHDMKAGRAARVTSSKITSMTTRLRLGGLAGAFQVPDAATFNSLGREEIERMFGGDVK